MNWKETLFKPKWQHKNPEIRLAVVSSEQDPRLISNLLEIASSDTDSRVRCAAIKRLHNLQNLLTLYTSEADAEAVSLLEDRIRQLASNTSETRPPLALRLEVANSTSNRALIEQLAAHAPEAELRRVALKKVQRQGFLGDCCINDEDAENRQIAASRITQTTTLKRVIGGLRKRDKALYSQLQERLHAEGLAHADPAAVQEEAVRICSTLEKLAIEAGQRDPAIIETAATGWERIAALVSPEMAGRYQRACERLSPKPVNDPTPEVVVAIREPLVEQPAEIVAPPESSEDSQASESLARAANAIHQYREEHAEQPKAGIVKRLRKQLESAWKQNTHPDDQAHWEKAGKDLQHLESVLERLDHKREQQLLKAQELLKQLQVELDDGELHKALISRATLQQVLKASGESIGSSRESAWKDIRNTLNAMQGRLRELREWQHWSNNKIRKRLIAEMEVLPAADLHPDALLDRIKSLQTEWKALEASEQIPGEKHFSAAPWMWRKFSAAGHTAFDSVRSFLDKRSEIQSREAQSLATFCAELEQLAVAEPADWLALGKGLNRGRKKLHQLNSIPARQRQKLAKQLKTALDKANTAMQAHYKSVEKAKMKLIRTASQLIHLPERDEAIAQAKALQAQWKDAGSLWRSGEQKLWTQFRDHLDPLFEKLKEQQATVRAADEEKLAAQKSLCKELKTILDSGEELAGQQGKVQGLQDSWRDITSPDRRLLQSFQTLVADYEQKVAGLQLQKINVDRDRWWEKSRLLHQLTSAIAEGDSGKKTLAKIHKAWPAENSEEPIERTMDRHFQAIIDGQTNVSGEDDGVPLETQARDLCIRLEFIAGLPSPEDEREQRMKYQVDRLAESMSGGAARQPATEEANEAEKTWLGMYALPEPVYSLFGKRIKQALATIMVTK